MSRAIPLLSQSTGTTSPLLYILKLDCYVGLRWPLNRPLSVTSVKYKKGCNNIFHDAR
jgi:hypothetical protein